MNVQWNEDHFPTPDCDDARARVKEVHKGYLHLLRSAPTRESIDAALREEEEAAEKAAEEEARADEAAERLETVEAANRQPQPVGTPQVEHATPEAMQASELPSTPPATVAPSTIGPENAKEALPPLHVPGALSEARLEDLRAIAKRQRAGEERKRLDKFRKDSRRARHAWLGALYAVGIWAAYGVGSLLGTHFQAQVVSKLGLNMPAAVLTLPLVAILALLLVFSCWGFARAQQLHRTSYKAPRDIPYLDNVGHIYEIEVFGGQADEAPSQLDKKLDTQRKTLVNGKTANETREELTHYRALFGVILVFFTIPNVLFYPHGKVEEIVMAILLAISPVVFAFFFSMLLANHTIDWPALSEELMDPSDAQGRLTQHDNLLKNAAIQQAEIRKLAEEAAKKADEARIQAAQLAAEREQRDLKQQAIQREKEAEITRVQVLEKEKGERETRNALLRTDKIKLMLDAALKQHVTDTDDKLAELREAASAFEQERGYSQREQAVMKEKLSQSKWVFWAGLIPLSVLTAIFATYPASLTINEIFNLGSQYFLQNKFALFPWMLWLMAMAIAEFLIIAWLHQRQTAEEQYQVLINFYDEQERINGHRYRIKTLSELEGTRKGAKGLLIGGALILLLEFAANAYYLLFNGDTNTILTVLLALVPLAVFAGLSFPHALVHAKRHRLQEALAWARSLPVPQGRVSINRNNTPGTSAAVREEYEGLTGYVDPASPKRKSEY